MHLPWQAGPGAGVYQSVEPTGRIPGPLHHGPHPLHSAEAAKTCVMRFWTRKNGYVQFLCDVGNLDGTSAEAKDKAVAACYERMVVLERQLGRIQEDLQLG